MIEVRHVVDMHFSILCKIRNDWYPTWELMRMLLNDRHFHDGHQICVILCSNHDRSMNCGGRVIYHRQNKTLLVSDVGTNGKIFKMAAISNLVAKYTGIAQIMI